MFTNHADRRVYPLRTRGTVVYHPDILICGGSLEIDGQDTKALPLGQLRPNVAFIPQQADLFTGSLRFNLDPMSKHSDAEIWEALRAARFAKAVKSSDQGLDMEIREGGANLSAGQRQCVSMARATLAACEICILDEATANVSCLDFSLLPTTLCNSDTLTIQNYTDRLRDG